MRENKTKPIQSSVSVFVDAVPDQSKRSDAMALIALMHAATGQTAAM